MYKQIALHKLVYGNLKLLETLWPQSSDSEAASICYTVKAHDVMKNTLDSMIMDCLNCAKMLKKV